MSDYSRRPLQDSRASENDRRGKKRRWSERRTSERRSGERRSESAYATPLDFGVFFPDRRRGDRRRGGRRAAERRREERRAMERRGEGVPKIRKVSRAVEILSEEEREFIRAMGRKNHNDRFE